MSKINTLVFNPVQVNTYVISSSDNSCIIVDPGCYGEYEEKILSEFIGENNLKPVKIIYTHMHVDHILGNNFVQKKWDIPYLCHPKSKLFIDTAKEFGSVMGLKLEPIGDPGEFLNHGDIVKFGDTELEVRYTPGHADGSICLVNHNEKYVLTGDVLFNSSIGRSDLPTGDHNTLLESIERELLTLDGSYAVYPGHGPASTIEYEKNNNPFLQYL